MISGGIIFEISVLTLHTASPGAPDMREAAGGESPGQIRYPDQDSRDSAASPPAVRENSRLVEQD